MQYQKMLDQVGGSEESLYGFTQSNTYHILKWRTGVVIPSFMELGYS